MLTHPRVNKLKPDTLVDGPVLDHPSYWVTYFDELILGIKNSETIDADFEVIESKLLCEI